jgi:DNA polymerase-3 subunit epsilon
MSGTMQEFRWGQAPEHLQTRKQLAENGLRPATKAKPAGQLLWGKGRRERFADLFDAREAVPKKKATEAQSVALVRATEIRKVKQSTCPGCGTQFPYVLGRRWDIDECPVCCRLEASGTAQQLLEQRALYVDFETTDLGGYAVELGIVGPDGETLFVERFNPMVPIEPEATNVHGIRDEDVSDCPTFADRFDVIRQILHGAVIVAYNARFDANVLARELARFPKGHAPCKAKWECAMELFDVFRGRGRSVPLPGGTHEAIGDCLAVRELVLHIAKADAAGED